MTRLLAMTLQITLPHHLLVDTVATRIIGEGAHGSFCLLPNHIDCLSILEPGIFIYESADGSEHYLAVSRGLLVKQGGIVSVSALNAISGNDLVQLQQAVETQFRQLDEQAQLVMSALARLEAGLGHHFSILLEGG